MILREMMVIGKFLGKMKHHKSIFVFSSGENIYRAEYKPFDANYKVEVFLNNESVWKNDHVPYGLKSSNPCKSQAKEIITIVSKEILNQKRTEKNL